MIRSFTAKVERDAKGQFVVLPDEVRFPKSVARVEVVSLGAVRIVRPARKKKRIAAAPKRRS